MKVYCKVKNERFNQILDEVLSDIKKLGLDKKLKDEVIIKLNSRYKTRLGNCKRIQKNVHLIEINKNLALSKHTDIYRNTLAHEFIHAMNIYNHTNDFKRVASVFNQLEKYNITRTSKNPTAQRNETLKDKYIVRCHGCYESWYYKKKGKVIRMIEKDSTSCKCPICQAKDFSVEMIND